MKKQLILIIIGALFFTGCDPFGDCEFDDRSGIAVALNLDEVTKPVNNVHIYGFDASDRLNLHKYYGSREELEADRLFVSSEGYTIIAVINVGENFLPLERGATKIEILTLMLTDFVAWLKGVESQYPDIMTGMGEDTIDNNGVLTIIIKINEGANLFSTILRLDVTVPEGQLPDYDITRIASHNIRTVAEVFKKGAATRIHSDKRILENSTLDLHLQPGDYEVLLWADYTPTGSVEDYHYSTSTLRGVKINENITYVPNSESRNAFSHRFEVTVTDQPVTQKSVTLEGINAKYRLVAIDVEEYKEFMATNSEDYPPIEDLTVTVNYSGYFPNSFDVVTSRPNDSVLGVEYSSVISDITATTALMSSDYLFTSGDDSHILASVTISKKNGDIVAKIPGVTIGYYRGYTTVIEADFFTAGVIDKGITIDLNWGGEINVYF